MPLTTIKTWPEASVYLQELIDTIDGDVKHLLTARGGAPFAICREVFSYVDHLGHLFSGEDKVNDRFQAFVKDVMIHARSEYPNWASVLYQMYRNGPIHQFGPKVVRNTKGQRLIWSIYLGAANDQHAGPHLQVRGDRSSDYVLPVSSVALIDDLQSAIRALKTMGPEPVRVARWNKAARRLLKDANCEFQV
jgi:hypothetical protein